MKKYLLSLLILSSPVYAGLISHNDYQSGTVITASGQNTNENTIVNEFNGNIDNSNIKSGAAVAVNKLAALASNGLVITDNSGFITAGAGSVVTNSSVTITGSLTVSSVTFSTNTLGIVGTTVANNANSGIVGEYISSTTIDTHNAPNSTHYGDVISITLTAGDWDVEASANWNTNASIAGIFTIGISTFTGDNGNLLTSGQTDSIVGFAANALNGANFTQITPTIRILIGSTLTYNLKYSATYGSGTPTINAAQLRARRVR